MLCFLHKALQFKLYLQYKPKKMHFFYINILILDAFYVLQNRGFIFRKTVFVVEHFWYICLLGRVLVGLSYERFIAISYKLKLPIVHSRTVGDR
jgi:hypothetical protein